MMDQVSGAQQAMQAMAWARRVEPAMPLPPGRVETVRETVATRLQVLVEQMQQCLSLSGAVAEKLGVVMTEQASDAGGPGLYGSLLSLTNEISRLRQRLEEINGTLG